MLTLEIWSNVKVNPGSALYTRARYNDPASQFANWNYCSTRRSSPSKMIGFTRVPNPWLIQTLKSSPSFKYTGGVLECPIPPGVPVIITVPAFKVVLWLKCDTNFATGKIMLDTLLSCITFPFKVHFSSKTEGLGMLFADTIVGPMGANPSNPLP